MSRLAWLLAGLVTVLVILLWWFLFWTPTQDQIRDVREQIETTEVAAASERARAAELRRVRDGAPEAAAELAAVDVLIPRDAALPALLRQLQQTADEAGVLLDQVSPSRPNPTEASTGTIGEISLSLSVRGNYFQLVDFARRLEDPLLSGRGLVWNSVGVSRGEHPELNISMAATVFTQSLDTGQIIEAPDDDADDTDDDEGLGEDETDEVDES